MAGLLDAKYVGSERIVIALDIGTTLSAASFVYLYPDDYTRIRMVNKWHGQMEAAGSSKVPTLVAYRHGQVEACGEEAMTYTDDSSYEIAKWFKLHLHPSSMRDSDFPPHYGSITGPSSFEIPSLPSSVSINQVYADFMKYLLANVQTSFEETIPNGATIWKRLEERRVFILTTPNGWDITQQAVLRNAALEAGLVKEATAHQLLEFVTEGEASVHYALLYSQSKTWLSPGSMFAVIDAGGSTVDSTLYQCNSTNPKVLLEEVCPSQCVQAGGVFVDRAAEKMLRQKLQDSNFSDEETIQIMLIAFENRTKRLFDGLQSHNVIEFGGSRDNDRDHGILKGKLSLSRQEIEKCFDGVIERIVQSALELLKGQKVQYIILVGGFGESHYLKRKLVERLNFHGASVVTVEEPSKKAAAEGALIWFIKQTVMARIARTTIGIVLSTYFRYGDPDHQLRAKQVVNHLDGLPRIPGLFGVLVHKGQKITADFCYTKPLVQLHQQLPTSLGSFSLDLKIWYGEGIPTWAQDEDGNQLQDCHSLCTIRGDLSKLRNSLACHTGSQGEYYRVDCDVVIRFGGTQLQATVKWKEGDLRREGPVTIIPNAIL